MLFALFVATAVAFLLGALASRTTGIYFLMLTLVYAVIGYSVFAQVTTISGPSGLSSIVAPEPFDDPFRLYHAGGGALGRSPTSRFKAIGRTNFGLALQGVRDDPVRMGSLGFNVPLHRTLAFTLAGFFAGVGGRAERLVAWADRPRVDLDRADPDPAHHRRHRRHLVLRGRLGRGPRVRRCSAPTRRRSR